MRLPARFSTSAQAVLLVGFLYVTFTRSSLDAALAGIGSLEKYYLVVALVMLVSATLAGARGFPTRLYRPGALVAAWVGAMFVVQAVLVGYGSTEYVVAAGTAVVVYLLLLPTVLYRQTQALQRALDIYLALCVASFGAQLLIHVGTGVFVDVHRLLHPWSRATDYFAFGSSRYSGWFLEPGNYANVVGFLTLVAVRLRRSVRPLNWVALVTLPLTNSYNGLIYAGLVLAALLWTERRILSKRRLVGAAVGGGIGLILLVSLADPDGYYVQRIDAARTGDGSAIVKRRNLDAYLNFDPVRQFTGVPFGENDCDTCITVNSNGLLFHAVFFFGVFGASIAAAPLFLARGRLVSVSLLAVILGMLLTRYSLFSGTGWATYGLAVYLSGTPGGGGEGKSHRITRRPEP